MLTLQNGIPIGVYGDLVKANMRTLAQIKELNSAPPNTGYDMFKHGAPISSPTSRLNDPLGASMQYSAWQSQVDRDYNTQMSNTAYQRAVADLRSAGLNPYLAYGQGGASAPTSAGARVNASNSYAYESQKLALEARRIDLEQDRFIANTVFSALSLGSNLIPHRISIKK